jgi:dTDP-4-dehydrorhamnose reductase
MSGARQPLAIWGGVECTLNRVGDRWFDQLAWSRHDERIADFDRFVYGSTKVEAERRVLKILPDALVIRTSAFFGPWDEHNFPAQGFRCLDRGIPFFASRDTVTPTYVPDLVHASLDFVIDGEHGISHLANQGEITWFDFAHLATERSGHSAELIAPDERASRGRIAIRPTYSALWSGRGRLLRPLEDALHAFFQDLQAHEVSTQCASR